MYEDSIRDFFSLARERYRILLSRRAGLPKPWSKMDVFREYRFCNVFREDDRVTEWFRDNVRAPMAEDPLVGFACVAFRFFNLPSTAEVMRQSNLFADWNGDRAREVLSGLKPLITGAYMVKTPLRKPKLEGLIEILDPVWEYREDIAQSGGSLEVMHHRLTQFPWIGPFMAYQAVCDMRYTSLLRDAPDINTWTCLGPGSARGISRILYDDPDRLKAGNAAHNLTANKAMIDILAASKEARYWPTEWPQWELSTVQHWACEYDKICRTLNLEGTPKQRFNGK